MSRVTVGMSIVLVVAAGCVVIVLAAGERQLGSLSIGELRTTLGGGKCQYCNVSTAYCTLYECREVGDSLWEERTGTGNDKAWCADGPGTCECNQTDITHVPCFDRAECYDEDCIDCGTTQVTDNVQDTCDREGIDCSVDTDCE